MAPSTRFLLGLVALALLSLVAVPAVTAIRAPAPRPASAAVPPPPTAPPPPPTAPPPPPTPYVSLPPFPQEFTATFSKIEAVYGQVINSTGKIYQDQRNQRCRMVTYASPTQPYYNLEQLAIYRPPYAQPNSAAASLLTVFNYGPYGVPKAYPALFSSRTGQTYIQSTYPFPEHWFADRSSQPNVGAFWQVPYYMYYNGTTTVNGVEGIRYVTGDVCNIAFIGVIPCTSYIINAADGTPLQTTNARMRRPNSYESDSYAQTTYRSFKLGPPDSSVFDLPSNWVQLYRNYNNGFQIDRPPGTSYAVVSPGEPLKITINLRTVPQAGLGVVSMSLFTAPDKNYNCTDCIQWSPSSVNFDTTNWHTPQTITLTYVKDGNQKLNIASHGGGYDYTQTNDYSYYLSFVACPGQSGSYCDSWRSHA